MGGLRFRTICPSKSVVFPVSSSKAFQADSTGRFPQRTITLASCRAFLQLICSTGATSSPADSQVVLTMETVQRAILGWNYFGIMSGKATRSSVLGMDGVPTSFANLSHYTRVFHVLLLEELRASLQQVVPSGPFNPLQMSEKNDRCIVLNLWL